MNQDYISSKFEHLENLGRFRNLSEIPDEATAVIVGGSRRRLEVVKGKEAKYDAKKELERSEKTLIVLKPAWLEALQNPPVVKTIKTPPSPVVVQASPPVPVTTRANQLPSPRQAAKPTAAVKAGKGKGKGKKGGF